LRAKTYLCTLLAALLLVGLSWGQMAEFDKVNSGTETSEPALVIGTSTEPQGLLPSVKRVQFKTETGWSSWISLKGVRLTTEPVAVSPEPGVVDIFSGGNDNDLWHIRLEGQDSWSDWTTVFGPPPYNKNLGGVHFRKYELAVITMGSDDGDYHIFTWGPTNHCLYKRCWGCDGSVSCDRTEDWVQMDGEIGSRPAAVLCEGKIYVFALDGSDNLVWNSADLPAVGSGDTPSWEGWQPLSGTFASPPTAACDGELIHVFALNKDGGIGHVTIDAETGDTTFKTIDLSADSAPAVIIEEGKIDLFATIGDELFHLSFDGDSWGEVENLKGTISGQPTAVSDGMGQIWVFALGQGDWLWGIYYGPEDGA